MFSGSTIPLWRIRFSDRHSTAHTRFYELHRAPGPDEVQSAMREHVLNAHSKKDTAPPSSEEADGITFLGMDYLPD